MRRWSSRLGIGLAAAAVCVALFGTQSVRAQQPSEQSITMTPSSTEVSLDPGTSGSYEFSLINQGDKAYTYSVYASPYSVSGEDYDPSFTPLPGKTDASEWVRVTPPATSSLDPHQLKNVQYTVSTPAGTAPGGYYAVIFAETNTTKSVNGVVSRNRVGNILYLNVKGDVKVDGTVSAGKLPTFTVGNNLSASLLVRNTGGTHFITKTSVTAKPLFGTTLTSDQARHVLPQTQRRIRTIWGHMPPFGIYHVSGEATVGGKVQPVGSRWVVFVHPRVLIGAVALIIIWVLFIASRRHKKQQAK